MELKDKALWEKGRANNTDPYGKASYDFAERWAELMEISMASGKQLADIAKDCSHRADTDGITGFMYGCAVGVLSSVWKHGEELRRWNNLDLQIKNEGEMANQSGRVLNPAIMSIEV